MVSRSLEKMVLIALGLMTVVIVGVPTLLVAIDTLSNTSELQVANNFADSLHNATAQVDTGAVDSISVSLTVPVYVSVETSDKLLAVVYSKPGYDPIVWDETYLHDLVLIAPTAPGNYIVHITYESETITITFMTIG
jgi:hypothetical protein